MLRNRLPGAWLASFVVLLVLAIALSTQAIAQRTTNLPLVNAPSSGDTAVINHGFTGLGTGFTAQTPLSGILGLPMTGDASAATVTVPNGVAQSTSAHNTETIDLRTLGAVPDGIWVVPNPSDTANPLYGATMAASSCTLTTTNGMFTAAMVGQPIDVMGAGPSGGLLATTIKTYVSANHITTNNCASTAVPTYFVANFTTAGGTPTASYAPGDTVTFGSGTFTTAAVGTIQVTTPMNATVNAAGSGGTANATCTVTGTLSGGTSLNGQATFTLNVTLNASGALSTITSVGKAPNYSANPTLTAVAVSNSSGCGSLSGATVNVIMGPALTTIKTLGVYTVFPSNPVTPSATSGSGAGATFTIHDGATGEYLTGTDDTAAFNKAIAQENTYAAAGIASCIYAPPGVYAIFGSSVTQFNQYVPGCLRGAGGAQQTSFVLNPSFSGPFVSTSDAWQLNIAPVNGAGKATQNGAGLAGPGDTFEDFSIRCDRNDPNEVDGIILYDHTDKVRINSVSIYSCPGRGISGGALTKNDTSAYIRESYIGNVRFENDGNTGEPVEQFSNVGNSIQANEIHIGTTDCYAPINTSCLVLNGGVTLIKPFGVYRAEGLENDPWNSQTDLVQFGDNTNTNGTLNIVQGMHFILVNPYYGAYGLGVYANNSGVQEYGLDISLECSGGASFGGCLNLQAGRLSNYHSADITSLGYDLTVGAGTGGDNWLTGSGFYSNFTSSINAASINDLLSNAFTVGGPGGGLQHTVTTVATIGTTCTAAQAGQDYVVTDATSPTFGSTVVGSGSTTAAVMCNGAHWTVY